MAAQKQEVELLIKAGTEGLKSIGTLVKELEVLGEDTGEASAQLEGLAGSLKQLRDQQKLVKQFADLKGQTRELADQQAKAKENATSLGKALSETEKPTKAQRVEFQKAVATSKAADKAWQDNQVQLNQLRTELSDAGISTRDLASEQQRIKRELSGVDDEINSVANELTQMRDSAREAAKGSKDLGDDVEESGVRVSKFRERLQGLNPLLGKIGSGLKTAGVAVAGFVASVGASAATLSVFSKSQAQVADELTNTGNALDVNREKLQLWRIAGDRVGLSGEKVTDILKRMTERLGEFSATGTGEAGNVLKRLNLDIEDLVNLKPDEQMLAIANAIGEIGSKSEQVALLEKLASDASQLQPLLENNAAGLQAIFEEAQKEGAIYTDAELDKLNKANDIYNSIDIKLKGLTTRIGAELAPVVADATDKVLDLFDQSEAGEKLIGLFKRLTDWGADMAAKLVENADDITAGFGTLWNTIEAGANGAMAVFRGLQTIVAGWATLVAGSFATVLTIAQGLAVAMNKVGLVSDETLNSISAKASAARDTVADLGKQTAEYGRKAVEAGRGVVGAFDDAAASSKKLKEETEGGVGTLTTLAENIKTTGDAAEAAMRKQQRATEDARRGLADYGVDIKEVMTGITSEAQEAIDDVGKLAGKIKEAGLASEESAKAFEAGFTEALAAVNTKEGLTALQEKIKGLKEAGELGAEGANAALETIRQKMLQVMGLDIDLGLEELPDDADSAGAGIDQVKDKTKDAAAAAEEARNKFREVWGAAFAKAISSAREQVTALSTAARNLFEMKIGGNAFVNEAESASAALERAQQRTDELASARRRLMSNSLAAWFADTALAASQVEEEFWSQAVAMENLQAKIESGSFSMDQLGRMSASAASRFNLLDSQRLNGLQSAIDSARQKLESLTDTADNTLSSLQQRLADIRGDTEEAQRIQYETERKRLQEQLKLAQQAGADEAAADYQKSLSTLEQIYQLEQKNRREEQNAREREAADRARDQQLAEIERQRAERELSQSTQRTTQARTETVKTVNVNLGGQSFRVLADDQDALMRALENARSTAL